MLSPQSSNENTALAEREAARAHFQSQHAWAEFRFAERKENWTVFTTRIAVRLVKLREQLALAPRLSNKTLTGLVTISAFLPLSIAIHTLNRLDYDGSLLEQALSLPDNIFTRVLHSRIRFLWRMQVLSRIFAPERRELVLAVLKNRPDKGNHD